jgi:hypothetical protein
MTPKCTIWGKYAVSEFRLLSRNYSFLLLFLISISFVLQIIPGYEKLLWLDPQLLIERPWTLITHIFLHGSFGHLFLNMFMLVFFAPMLERKVGSSNFLLIFFLSGIVAGLGYSLTSVYPAVGASGALYGVFGALAVLMPQMKVYLFPLPIPLQIWMVVIFFAVFEFLMIPVPDMIAHTAHLSGLLVGVLAGMRLKRK